MSICKEAYVNVYMCVFLFCHDQTAERTLREATTPAERLCVEAVLDLAKKQARKALYIP